MNKFKIKPATIAVAMILAFTASIISGCNDAGKNNPSKDDGCLELDTLSYTDSITDAAGNEITAYTYAVMPSSADGSENQRQTIRLLIKNIFDMDNDSLMLPEAIKKYTSGILDIYRNDIAAPSSSNQKTKYRITNIIAPTYRSDRIWCFLKTSEMEKNGKQSILTNRYYSFEAQTMERINLTDIFNDKDISIVSDLLKKRLIQQEKVSDQSQLIELGYFNIDNLSASNNFYFTDKGIVFCYEPFEIACYAIGEVEIELDYNVLKPYIRQDFHSNILS